MTFPRLRSVRAKLLVSSMLPVVVAVLLVAVVSDAFVRTQFRAEMIASLEATASLIAENGSVSLAFEDETDAAAVLASLASHASVVAAALYSAEGVLFVAYPDSASVPARMPAAAENRMGDVTTIREVVLASGELVGFAYIRSDMGELVNLIRRVRLAELAIVMLALVVAFGLSTGLHRTILGPVAVLSQTAHRVTEGRDFGARVSLKGADELGQLGLAFNEMLDEIERNTARLRARESYFRSLIENSTDLTTVVDIDGLVLYQSPSVRAVLSRSPDSVRGQPLTDLVHPEDQEALVATVDAVFADPGTVKALVWRASHASGAWRYLDAVARAHEAEDGTRVAVINARDVTARRAMEAEQEELAAQLLQAQKMEAVGQLTGGVAHDFNNLLTVILGNLELAEEDSPASLQPLLAAARESAQRGASLTQRLLAFSRKQALQPKTVDLHELVEGMADLLRRTLGETYAIVVSGDSELWSCTVDPIQLENAILNLAINARDAMPKGGRLSITCANCGPCPHVEGAAGDFVTLTVTDNGTGISEEILGQVFDPFFTTKDVGSGSGLGLSMVYGFVMQSDGSVEMHSELGEGTSVVIHLPRSLGSRPQVVEREIETVKRRGQGQTILVVEDDPHVQELSLTLLERMGYKTLYASDGATALRLLEDEHSIDLLFTDIALPGGMSGVELADRALSHEPGLSVLYTSGYTEKSLGVEALTRVSSLLKKPFTREELSRRIDEVLQHRSRV